MHILFLCPSRYLSFHFMNGWKNAFLALGYQFKHLDIEKDITFIQKTMWENVGIVRSNKRLSLAEAEITKIYNTIVKDFSQSHITKRLLELRNLAEVSSLIIQSAIQRQESRGLHYNVDYPIP